MDSRRTEIHKFGQDTGRVFHLLTEQLKLDHGQFWRYFKMPACQFGDFFKDAGVPCEETEARSCTDEPEITA